MDWKPGAAQVRFDHDVSFLQLQHFAQPAGEKITADQSQQSDSSLIEG